MKVMKLISVIVLVLGATAAQASIVMPDLRMKEQVGNFNPQPDPPGKNAEARIGTFNPQPEIPGKQIILQ